MRPSTDTPHTPFPLSYLAAGIVALGLLVPTLASADETVRGWAHGEASSPEMSDLIPKLSSSEAYSERYGFSTKLDGGGEVVVNFTISNLGWGDGQGAVEVKIKHPKLDDKYHHKKQYGRSNWSFADDTFELKMGDTRVEGSDDDTFELHHDGSVKLRMKMTSNASMWSPGRGKITVGDGKYYQMDVIGLRATSSGKVQIGDKWHDIDGTRSGYADHVATNVAPFNLGKRFSRFRVYDDDNDVFAIWREIRLVDKYGGKSVSFLMLGYKNKIVFSDPDATTKFGRIQDDPHTGYRVPYAVQINGQSGEDSAKVVLKGTDVNRKNLLKGYGSVARALAKQMAEPWNYYFNAEYAIQMNIQGSKAKVDGEAGYVVDMVNK